MKTRFVFLFFFLLPFFLSTPNSTAAAQIRQIKYGMTVDGTLTPDVPAHEWMFGGGQGDVVTIGMDAVSDVHSGPPDTLLTLTSPAGTVLARDIGGDGTSARIENFLLPQAGPYLITTTTISRELTLRYQLSLMGEQATVTPEPVIPALKNVDPDQGLAGSQLALVLRGVGFSQIGSLQRVALGGLEIPVLEFTFVSDEQVQAVIAIPPKVPGGEREISFFFEEYGFDFPFSVSTEPGDEGPPGEEPGDDEQPPAEPGDEEPPGESSGDDEQPPEEPADEDPSGEEPGDDEQLPGEPGDEELPPEEPPAEEPEGEQPGSQAPATSVPTVLPTFIGRVTVVTVIVEQRVPQPDSATPTPQATVEPTPTPTATVEASAVDQLAVGPSALEREPKAPAPSSTPVAAPEINEAAGAATEIPLLYAAAVLFLSLGSAAIWRWLRTPANSAGLGEAMPPVSPPPPSSPPSAPPPRLRFKHDWSVGGLSLDTGGKPLTLNVDIRFRNGVARTVRRVEVHASSLVG